MEATTINELKSKIAIIVLAAGSSSRMGRSKQLLEIDNIALLRKTVLTGIDTGVMTVIAVLGANADKHRSIIEDLNVSMIINPDWKKGIGSSLKAGVRELIRIPTIERAIVLVCDQPELTHQHIHNLADKHKLSKKNIVASKYANTIGVPALFDRSMFSELLKLDDDEGAKKLFATHRNEVVTVDFPGGEIDLDTQMDYEKYIGNR